jgi:RND superfamily putative drug exporter
MHSRRAYDLLSQGFGPGVNGPLILSVDMSQGGRDKLDQITSTVATADDISFVQPPIVNAAGDIWDWRSARIVAGARRPDGSFADSVEAMRAIVTRAPGGALEDPALRSTTLVVVATNVEFNKTMLTKLAMMANCGAGRAIRPYHTTGDGDPGGFASDAAA